MSSIGGAFTRAPAAAAAGIGGSLALARAANPRTSLTGSFDQHLDLAVATGIGSGAATGSAATSKASAVPPLLPLGGAGGVTSVEALRVEHAALMAQFEDRFRQLLRERGIDLGEGVVLQTDVHGDVRVAGDHPHRDAIERLLRDDAELRNLFVRLDGQASRLRAADVAAELTRLQAQEPDQAAAQVQRMLDGSSHTLFSLAVRPNEMLVQFN